MELISYITECLQDNKLIRWPDSCMPLKVYIAPFRWYKAKDDSYYYKQMVIDAMNIWQNASNNKVSFTVVNTLNESQINLDWRRINRESLGHCYYNFDSQGRLFSAEVQIGLSDGILDKEYQDKNEVFHTILHEFGHALGVGHSPYKDDIMYVPHQYGVAKLSPKDECTLKWLYTFSYGVESNELLLPYSAKGIKNLDQLIYSLEKNTDLVQKETAPFKDFLNPAKGPNLDKQQQLLANINKYNLAMQNVSLSFEMQDRIKKIALQKHNKNKPK